MRRDYFQRQKIAEARKEQAMPLKHQPYLEKMVYNLKQYLLDSTQGCHTAQGAV